MGSATLMVCAGHGGNDRGNTSTGYVERDELITIKQSITTWLRLKQVPLGIGGIVLIDDSLDLEKEIQAITELNANVLDGDLAIDLHLDYQPGTISGGALAIYDETLLSKHFGMVFLERWCSTTGIPNRGIHRSSTVAPLWRGWEDFGFCKPSWPGVIIELGTLNAQHDMEILQSPIYQAFIGELLWECWESRNRG